MKTTNELDLEQFWRDNAVAYEDPFGAHIPQVPMSMPMGYHMIFDELGIPEDHRRWETDYDWARSCARAYNDRAEKIVGKRLLDETAYDPSKRFPYIKSVGELFECERIWQSESWWLKESAHTPDELKALLDRVEKLDIEAAMFPANWETECKRIYEQHGIRPVLSRGGRGPVTLATSIYGTENLIYLILDDPGLAVRFRDVILKVWMKYSAICEKHSDPARIPKGYSFLDDNCALLSPAMYELFGLPIVQGLYDRFAPTPEHTRFQHSDSDMGHLLPLLATTGMNRVNFGPNVRFAAIRKAMPKATVCGTLAPFTFMRNDEAGIEREVRRDIDESRETRGLVLQTAGSVNNGTRLTSLRKVMQTIVEYGRFEERG